MPVLSVELNPLHPTAGRGTVAMTIQRMLRSQNAEVSRHTYDQRNAEILRRVTERGNVALSNASVRGRFALRACIVNHLTTDADIAAIVEEVLSAAPS